MIDPMSERPFSNTHWTIVGRGPSGSLILVCTHAACGVLDVFGDRADALDAAKDHAEQARNARGGHQ